MVIKTSGDLSISDIVTEFGGTAPHSLSEYYRGGSLVPDSTLNQNIPLTGSIRLSDFYGAQNTVYYTISTSIKELNLRSYLLSLGWNGITNTVLTIASGVYIWSDDTSVAGLVTGSFPNGLTIINNGFIIGKGGTGGLGGGLSSAGIRKNGLPGGAAITINTNTAIVNNGYIAGGGGGGAASEGRNDGGDYVSSGGGGGAGGGEGGYGSSTLSDGITIEYIHAGGAGGAIGQVGSNGVGDALVTAAPGGGSGGAGAHFVQEDKASDDAGGGGGGGRILPGTGGVNPQNGSCNGGDANNPGSDTSGYSGAGGGGWGARGGNNGGFLGGAGGSAIVRNGYTVTIQGNLTTIYGAVA